MTPFEKTLGCLAGLALGDALGMATEFLTPEQIIKAFSWLDRLRPAPAWHPHAPMQPGEVTDDTRQALAVAHAYDARGVLTAESVARELLAWESSNDNSVALCMGPSTRQALEQLRQGVSPTEAGKAGKTNGAAMRAAVVGLMTAGHPDATLEDVVSASLPTHGTGVAIAGAASVACAVAVACDESATLTSIIEAAKWGAREGVKRGAWAWGTPLEGRIELAEKVAREANDPKDVLRGIYSYVGTDMLVAESVAAAFGVFLLAEGDPMRAIMLGANIGGDTDTIAAIAGAIGGAWQGMEAIDAGMLALVEKVNDLDFTSEANRLIRILENKQA
ncbi:MAG TPA: ADP-ribosylglycohydrolase family protein [Longilinea sp.]|nr:ADP-ribosylglycohydrolase family protein [Longilinea sp.]